MGRPVTIMSCVESLCVSLLGHFLLGSVRLTGILRLGGLQVAREFVMDRKLFIVYIVVGY